VWTLNRARRAWLRGFAGALTATSLGVALPTVVASGCSSTSDPTPHASSSGASFGAGGSSGAANGGSSAGAGGAVPGTAGASSSSGNTGSSGSSAAAGSSGNWGAGGGSTFDGVFYHPGVIVNGAQLAFLKQKLAAKAQPWTDAFEMAKTRKPPSYLSTELFASLDYTPKPVPDICCGSQTAPDVGCRAEQFDGLNAVTHALFWALTGEPQYAQQSLKVLNAYSATLKTHVAPETMCGTPAGLSSNTPVQSGWTGSLFARAAEIMRTYSGWQPADIERFSGMLRSAYLPHLVNGAIKQNGNWELSMADALVQIGVFLDDKATFEQGLTLWRRRVPAYFYLKSDGPTPQTLPGQVAKWNATVYFDGLSQETCRDLGHVQYGLAAAINAAETARIQGVDLYSEQATRLVAALELTASYLNGATMPDPGCPYDDTEKIGFPNPASNDNPMWEIAYNQYATRAGMSLPNTKALIARIRPTAAGHHMAWETLTHAEVGSVGLPP
jgi:hypothetical protein